MRNALCLTYAGTEDGMVEQARGEDSYLAQALVCPNRRPTVLLQGTSGRRERECVCMCVCVCVHACTCVCMHARVCVCACMHMV